MYYKIIKKYPSEIKIGDLVEFENNIICRVTDINKKQRHSRENGYPYEFIGKLNDVIYKKVYYSNVITYIEIKTEKVK